MSEQFKNAQEAIIQQIEDTNKNIEKIIVNKHLNIASSAQLKEIGDIKKKNEIFKHKLISNEFEIAIVGLEKAGKSTFANALIQNTVLPSAPERCTYTTTRLTSGSDKASIEFYSSDEFNLIFQEMLKELNFPNSETITFKNLEKNEFEIFFTELEQTNTNLYKNHVGKTDQEILEILKFKNQLLLDQPILEFTGDELNTEEFQVYIKGEKDNTSKPRSVKRIEIQSSKLNQIKNAIIYDVPGFDSPTKLHLRQTEERLKKADAIILVTNIGTNPSIQGTSLSVIRNNTDDDGISLKDKLFVFGNQIDRVNTAEQVEGNRQILLDDLKKYQIGDESNIFTGSARLYLIDQKLMDAEFNNPYQIDFGIEAIREKLTAYYETERFEILKRKIDANHRRLKSIFQDIRTNHSSLEQIHSNNPDTQRSFIITTEQKEMEQRLEKALKHFKEKVKHQIYNEKWLSQNIHDEIHQPMYFQAISEEDFDRTNIETNNSVRRDIPIHKINSNIREEIHIKYLEQFLDLIKNITNEKCNVIESDLINEFCLAVRGSSINNDEVNHLCESLIKKITADIAHSALSFTYLIERFSRDVFDITLSYPLCDPDRSGRFEKSEKDIVHLDHYYSNGKGELINVLLTQKKASILDFSMKQVSNALEFLLRNTTGIPLPKMQELSKLTENIKCLDFNSAVKSVNNIQSIIHDSGIRPSKTAEEVVAEINNDIENIRTILIKAVIPAINLELAFFNSVDKQIKLLISALKDTDNRHTGVFNQFISTVIPIVKKQELDNILETIKQQELKQEILDALK